MIQKWNRISKTYLGNSEVWDIQSIFKSYYVLWNVISQLVILQISLCSWFEFLCNCSKKSSFCPPIPCFWSCPKSFGISKIKLDFPNIDWNFKSLGHKFLNELESFTTCGTIRSKSIRLRNWKRIRYSLRWLLHFNAQEPLTTIAHGWARVTDCMWRKETFYTA